MISPPQPPGGDHGGVLAGRLAIATTTAPTWGARLRRRFRHRFPGTPGRAFLSLPGVFVRRRRFCAVPRSVLCLNIHKIEYPPAAGLFPSFPCDSRTLCYTFCEMGAVGRMMAPREEES